MNSVIGTIKKRRSRYALEKEITISDPELKGLIENIVEEMPTQMNSQSSRPVVLLGRDHDRLWDIALEELKKVTTEEQYEGTLAKVNGAFKSGYGTILYYEDQQVVRSLEEQFPAYAHNFPSWSVQSSGMLQMTIWSALADEGIGASIQHYNELIDSRVREEWKVPSDWKMVGQMPFGVPADEPGEKEVQPVGERVVFHQS